MPTKRQFCHGMVVANETDRLGVADLINDVDATTRLVNAEAATCQDLLIALCVQLREALAELKLLAIDPDGAVGMFFSFHSVGR